MTGNSCRARARSAGFSRRSFLGYSIDDDDDDCHQVPVLTEATVQYLVCFAVLYAGSYRFRPQALCMVPEFHWCSPRRTQV